MRFIEARGFSEKLRATVDDEIYRAFQNELQLNPTKGDLIQGTGGVRKARMRTQGRGKSGGARVIYLYLEIHDFIYFLSLYTKQEQADLTPEQKKIIRGVAEGIKREHRNPV